MKTRIYKIVQLLWVALVLFFIAWYLKNNLENLKNYEFRPQWSWLFLALVCESARRLTGGLRWFLVSTPNREGDSWIGFLEHLHTFFVSNLAMYIPGTVWQVMSRVHLGQQKGQSALKVSMGIVYEMAFMVWSGTVVASYMLSVIFEFTPAQWIAMILAMVVLSIVLVHPAFVNAALRLVLGVFRRPVSKVRTSPGHGLVLLFVSLLAWIFGGTSLYFISRSIMPDLGGTFLPYVISLYAMGWVIGFLTPWAPAGLGIRDGIFVWGLSAYLAAPLPILVAGISRLISVLPDLFWATLSHMMLKRLEKNGRIPPSP